MKYFAICNKEQINKGVVRFIKNKRYDLNFHTNEMFDIKDEQGVTVSVCLDDPDFCYVLHCPEWIDKCIEVK